MAEPSHRKSLNQEQLKVLRSLYTFRFGTAELFAKSQGNVTQRYMNERLRILCEQEYIGRKYDGVARLYGKPAAYYLLEKGVDILKQSPEEYNPRVLARLKAIKIKSGPMWHYINVFRTFIRCRELYGDSIKFLTKSNLAKLTYFPKKLPDAYIIFGNKTSGEMHRAMIEYFDWSQPLSAMKRRISDLITHADSGIWTSRVPYPEIWILCETPELEQKIRRWTAIALEKSWEDRAVFYTTTKKVFFDKDLAANPWEFVSQAAK